MKDTINILCATDANYAALCGIMLTSLLRNNLDSRINIFILTEGISKEDNDKYYNLEKIYNTKINLLQIEKSQFEKCPLWAGDHLSVAAYYRLMAPELLPEDIDKILYLDCDIIVNNSIKELWNENIDGYAIGAIIDAQFYNDEFYERLCIPQKNKYFNSGVMLMNLKYWRDNNVTDRCFECILKKKMILKYHDQDTLNVVLNSETKLLPLKYNLQSPFLMKKLQEYYTCMSSEIHSAIKRPIIIHYIGGGKPWWGLSFHPYRTVFFENKHISFWKNTQLTKFNIKTKDKIKFQIVNLLILAGIKNSSEIFINVKMKLTWNNFIYIFRES